MGKIFLYLTQNLSFKFIVLLTFIITGYLRFVHESLPIIRNFDVLISKYGYLIDFFFVVSAVMILLTIVFYVFKLLRNLSVEIKNFLKMAGRIEQLTASEQSVLREFHIQHSEIVYMPFNDPVVKILINDGFLRFVSDIMKYDHIPLQQTKNYLRFCKRELIGIPEDSPELLMNLSKIRPRWANNLYRQTFL